MYKKNFKPFLDMVFGIIVFPFFLILFLILAPLIKLEDKGPVLYKALRVGRDGKLFNIYKFRSMKVNAPDIRISDGSTYNGKDDSRVTKIGTTLRRTSLDEIPQILNVLKGDMSIIGPRPSIPNKENDNMHFLRLERRKVRPGITGFTQAYYRNSITQDEKLKYDAEYVNKISFSLDCKILIKTIKTVIKKDHVYMNESTKQGEKEDA